MVTDANIWIDLLHGHLAGRVFELGEPLIAPDFVLEELEDDQEELVRLGLEVVTLDPDQTERMVDLVATYEKCSTPDLASLLLAIDRGIILLTGDGALRAAAEKLGVEVHGTLWVLDRLVEGELIGRAEACVGLQRIVGSFLPAAEVGIRCRTWC